MQNSEKRLSVGNKTSLCNNKGQHTRKKYNTKYLCIKNITTNRKKKTDRTKRESTQISLQSRSQYSTDSNL